MGPVHYHAGDFPPRDIDWKRLVPRLNPTATAVARYDGMLAAVPNPAILLSPLTTQEAVLSSKIEGTQATMGEVLGVQAEHLLGVVAVGRGRRPKILGFPSLLAIDEGRPVL